MPSVCSASPPPAAITIRRHETSSLRRQGHCRLPHRQVGRPGRSCYEYPRLPADMTPGQSRGDWPTMKPNKSLAWFKPSCSVMSGRGGHQRRRVHREHVQPRGEPVTVAQMADWAPMSRRSFQRRFADATRATPLAWLHQPHQRTALESTDLPIDDIAAQVGLGTPANLRSHFRKATSITPSRHRQQFFPRPIHGIAARSRTCTTRPETWPPPRRASPVATRAVQSGKSAQPQPGQDIPAKLGSPSSGCRPRLSARPKVRSYSIGERSLPLCSRLNRCTQLG
jgi:AraC-like DNA-binding protein